MHKVFNQRTNCSPSFLGLGVVWGKMTLIYPLPPDPLLPKTAELEVARHWGRKWSGKLGTDPPQTGSTVGCCGVGVVLGRWGEGLGSLS